MSMLYLSGCISLFGSFDASCVDHSTSIDRSLYPATNSGNIDIIYETHSAENSSLDTPVEWQTDPRSIAPSSEFMTLQENDCHAFMPMSHPINYSVS
jgi:hypothetical protein